MRLNSGFCLRSISSRSRLRPRKAISIPEKNAENISITAIVMSVAPILSKFIYLRVATFLGDYTYIYSYLYQTNSTIPSVTNHYPTRPRDTICCYLLYDDYFLLSVLSPTCALRSIGGRVASPLRSILGFVTPELRSIVCRATS